MNIIVWLLLVIMAFYFWIVGRSEQDQSKIMNKILYLLLAFIVFLVASLLTFTVTNDTVKVFDNTGEQQGIHYLLLGFAFISFLEMLVNSVMVFNIMRNKQTNARDDSR